MCSFAPEYKFYGEAINHDLGERKLADNSLVAKLREIIFTSDVDSLRTFKDTYPEIVLYHGYNNCERRRGQYITSLSAVTMSQTCNEQLESKSNILGEKFIDVLFECGYITNKDIYIVFNMLCEMAYYEKWDDVIYLIKKMDHSVLKSYYSETNGSGMYYMGIGDAFYSSCVTHYYGKMHGKAIECFRLLKSIGILPRDERSGEEITHRSKTDFWDMQKDISYAKAQESFGKRDIEYWDSLPSSSDEIL